MNLPERSKIFKALGHPARLAVVEHLASGPQCVCDLMELPELSNLSGPTVSQHLLVLRTTGIITDEKRGKNIFYHLQMPCVASISLCISERQPCMNP